MRSRNDTIPDSPPTLQAAVYIPEGFSKRAARILGLVSDGLNNMPVVLSQQADVIAFAGQVDENIAQRMAYITYETWQQGATGIAREYVRFQEETFVHDDESRLTLLLYSRHVKDALVLTVGWQITVSLTQIRAEVRDAQLDLLDALGDKRT